MGLWVGWSQCGGYWPVQLPDLPTQGVYFPSCRSGTLMNVKKTWFEMHSPKKNSSLILFWSYSPQAIQTRALSTRLIRSWLFFFNLENFIFHFPGLWYRLPGEHSKLSSSVFLANVGYPFRLINGMMLKVWYGEDLKGYTEHDNRGRVCVDVYAWFA